MAGSYPERSPITIEIWTRVSSPTEWDCYPAPTLKPGSIRQRARASALKRAEARARASASNCSPPSLGEPQYSRPRARARVKEFTKTELGASSIEFLGLFTALGTSSIEFSFLKTGLGASWSKNSSNCSIGSRYESILARAAARPRITVYKNRVGR